LRVIDRAIFPDDYLCFKCPHCNLIHCIYVNSKESRGDKEYHVWKYEKLSESQIKLTPSFDASKYCGYHGPYEWIVDLTLTEDEAKKGMIDPP